MDLDELISSRVESQLQDLPNCSSQLLDVEIRGLEPSAPLPQRRHSYQDILKLMFGVNCSDSVLY